MKHPEYRRFILYGIDFILVQIAEGNTLYFKGKPIEVNIPRLQTYLSGTECKHCGLNATFFAVEAQRPKWNNYHLNLYGLKDGREVMLTSDHIIPKSKGGSHDLSNRQTLCQPCNKRKKDRYEHQLIFDRTDAGPIRVSNKSGILRSGNHQPRGSELATRVRPTPCLQIVCQHHWHTSISKTG